MSEGYHNGLRYRLFTSAMPVYQLLKKLWSEAEKLPLRMGPLARRGRVNLGKKRLAKERLLNHYWLKLENSYITTEEFLSNIQISSYIKEDPHYAKNDCRVDLE